MKTEFIATRAYLKPCPVDFSQKRPDYAERIRVRNRATRWAFEAARCARLQNRRERIRQRAYAAANVARDLRAEGDDANAAHWRALEGTYLRIHTRLCRA